MEQGPDGHSVAALHSPDGSPPAAKPAAIVAAAASAGPAVELQATASPDKATSTAAEVASAAAGDGASCLPSMDDAGELFQVAAAGPDTGPKRQQLESVYLEPGFLLDPEALGPLMASAALLSAHLAAAEREKGGKAVARPPDAAGQQSSDGKHAAAGQAELQDDAV